MRPIPVCALALVALSVGCSDRNVFQAPPPPTVEVSQPAQRSVTEYLEFTGRLEAVATVQIRARVQGFLEKRFFEEGQFVKEGDLLYRIDPREYQARVDGARASIDTAKASILIAEATLKGRQKAFETNAVAEIDVIEAQAQLDRAKGVLANTEARLITAELDLSYTELHAPLTGVIGDDEVDMGNLVGAGEQTLLNTIVQYHPIYAVFDLSERDLLGLMADSQKEATPEQRLAHIRTIPVELGLSNEEGYPHAGHLHYVDQEVDAQTGTLLCRAIFDNPEPIKLIPGFFVRTRIPVREREGALIVPEEALGSDQGGRYLLLVDDQNVVRHRRVEVGQKEPEGRVITSGLEPNDWVVVAGMLRARPGAAVTTNRRGAPDASPTPPPASGG